MTEDANSQPESASPGELKFGHPAPPTERELRALATVQSLSSVFWGYHKGPQPRAGTRVRRPYDGRAAVVLGVTLAEKVLVAFEDGGGLSVPWREDIASDRRAPRASLKHVIELAIDWARRGDSFAINLLIGHLNGINGERYRNPVALAWMALAFYRASLAREHTDLRNWARDLVAEVEDLALGRERLPSEILEAAALPLDGDGAPIPAGDRIAAVEQAIACMGDDLAALDDDATHLQEAFTPGEIAFDPEDVQLVVLGRSTTDSEPGWVDVLDPELALVTSCHLDDLDLQGYQEEPEALEMALWDAAAAGSPPAMLHLLNIDRSDSPNAVLRRTLMGGIAFRTYGDSIPSAARQAQKAMLAAYKALPKELRARVAGLLPETVNTRSKQSHQPMGRPEALLDAYWQACEKVAAERAPATPPDEAAPVEASIPEPPRIPPDVEAYSEPVERAPLAVAEPATEGDYAAPPAEPVPIESPAVAGAPAPAPAPIVGRRDAPAPRASANAIAFKAPSRALRFKLTHHSLLAMEWGLRATPASYDTAVASTMAWLSSRMGMTLPTHWKTGGHELEQSGVELHVEAARNLFAFRLQHPDTEHPTRTWRLEATLVAGPEGHGGIVGLRLDVQDRVDMPRPPTTIPSLIRAWDGAPGLLLGDQLSTDRRVLRTPADVAQFRQTVRDPGRDVPVWVVQHETELELPPNLQALAQTVVVEADALGMYQTSFGLLPPALLHAFGVRDLRPERVKLGVPATLPSLQDMALGSRAKPNIPTFREVREAIRDAAERRAAAAPVAEVGAPAAPDTSEPASAEAVEAMPAPANTPAVVSTPAVEDVVLPDRPSRLGYSDMQELLDLAIGEKEEAERELFRVREQLRALKARQSTPDATPEPVVITRRPTTLAELPSWAPRMAPRVIIAEKALRFAARCEHRDVDKIFLTLEALRDIYWPMRFNGENGARERWLTFLTENRLRCGPIGTALETSRYADAYQALVGTRTITSSLHIQGSSSRDPLRCLRIYFQPDEDSQSVVITHLPTHLTSTLT